MAAYIFLSVVAFAVGMLLLVRPVWCRCVLACCGCRWMGLARSVVCGGHLTKRTITQSTNQTHKNRLIQYTEKSESRAFQTFLMALTFLIIFFSAWVTEILGVHAIFGAFLFGALSRVRIRACGRPCTHIPSCHSAHPTLP